MDREQLVIGEVSGDVLVNLLKDMGRMKQVIKYRVNELEITKGLFLNCVMLVKDRETIYLDTSISNSRETEEDIQHFIKIYSAEEDENQDIRLKGLSEDTLKDFVEMYERNNIELKKYLQSCEKVLFTIDECRDGLGETTYNNICESISGELNEVMDSHNVTLLDMFNSYLEENVNIDKL